MTTDSLETVEPLGEGQIHQPHDDTHTHPSDLQYVYIALFLAAVTAAEVLLYYYPPEFVLMAVLLGILGVVKFATVAMFFMHLRFDSRLFRYFFCSGLALAVTVYVIVLTTFHFWTGHGAGVD